MSKNLSKQAPYKKAPHIEGLSKNEIKMWLNFCKSVYQNLNKT